jgi:hypothetical protein
LAEDSGSALGRSSDSIDKIQATGGTATLCDGTRKILLMRQRDLDSCRRYRS